MFYEYNYFNDDNRDITQIEDKLWLGNSFAALNIPDLKEKGITKILTVMDGQPNYYNNQDGFKHKTIAIMDVSHQNIIQYFGECIYFIKGNENILVHCSGGISRSATIVIAYIMWKNKMKYEEAFQYVKNKRSVVWPNPGFKEQLKIFEKLLITNNYDISKINFKGVKWTTPEKMNSLSFY